MPETLAIDVGFPFATILGSSIYPFAGHPANGRDRRTLNEEFKMRRPALRIIIGRLSLALAVAMIAATWSSQALGADSRLKRAGEAIKDKIFGSRLLTSAFKRVALRAAIKAYGPRPEGALPVEPMMGRETLSSFHYDTKHKVYMGAFNVGTMFFGTLDHVKPIAVGIKPSVIAAAKGNAVRTTILPNDWLLRTSWSQVKSHSVQVPVD